MWLVRKIGLDAKGEIDRVQWQEANVLSNSWIGQPRVCTLAEVLTEMRAAGVAMHFEDDGAALRGPWLKLAVLANGHEAIEADIDRSEGDRRSVWDLPRL